MRDTKKECTQCGETGKKVMRRVISPSKTVICCSDCAMRMRAIDSVSGTQQRADEPPEDNGVFTH